jgi:ribosomal protein S18 acetylase RimI-like enzyme
MKSEAEKYFLRPATLDEVEELFSIHQAALGEYIAATWGWDEAWQRDFFRKGFTLYIRSVIEVGGRSIGFLDVTEREEGVYLQNIELAPEYQNRGIGTEIIQRLIARARARRGIVRLQVLRVNARAKALYERLGFEDVGETETHFLMQHRAI